MDSSLNQDQLKEEALAYFKSIGIDPNVKPDADSLPSPSTISKRQLLGADGVTTEACTIFTISVVFYTYVKVAFSHHNFEGHAGGVGVGGLPATVGVIYFADLKVLLATKDFGIFYVADDGGACHVTWGTHGNATVVGIGAGAAAMGGKGKWS